ncbi:MAG: hypothetical protein J6Y36_07170 [Treponema sp.]|nr:hypothetical protein [Treponema sp.]
MKRLLLVLSFGFVLLFPHEVIFANEVSDNSESKEITEQSEKDSGDKSDSKDKEIIPEYDYILDKSEHLHLHTYKDENVEYLSVNKNAVKHSRSVVIYSNKKMKRYFYDKDFYLDYIEVWTGGEKSSDYKIEKVITYKNLKNTDGSGSLFYEVCELDSKNKTYTVNVYNNRHLLFEKNEYDVSDLTFTEKGSYSGEILPSKKTYAFLYKYDELERITFESETHYEYYKNSKKVKKKNVRKNIYEFVRYGCPPDKTFYENDVLRMKTVYTSEDDYVQYVYFDNDVYVKVDYKHGRKYSEIFYVGNEEKVKKIYE